MGELERITEPLLDVLEVLLDAAGDNRREMHGWAVMRLVERSGPTVYGVFDRLEDAGWITGRWEQANPRPGKPPRRLYELTGDGVTAARNLLAQRRPARPSRNAAPLIPHLGGDALTRTLGRLRRVWLGQLR